MRLELSLSAYDILDRVHVSASIRKGDGSKENPYTWVNLLSDDCPSVGETDPVRWARDAIQQALEAF